MNQSSYKDLFSCYIIISISEKRSRDQNLKTIFPKQFFNEIWLKVEEHE